MFDFGLKDEEKNLLIRLVNLLEEVKTKGIVVTISLNDKTNYTKLVDDIQKRG